MSKNTFTIVLILLMSVSLQAQKKFTISGVVADEKNKETLIGVSLFVQETKTGLVTNEYGFYSITLPEGDYTLLVNYMGYQTVTEKIKLNQDLKKNIYLSVSSQQLDEVVIVDNKKRVDIRKPEMSVNKLTIQEIKEMPVIFGEVDVLKSILTLPGVTNAGEGQSGFNV
ncbi:MAG: carboxypeptidase-like regulatory domain-containing protein, partial [Flavobacterium sp.]